MLGTVRFCVLQNEKGVIDVLKSINTPNLHIAPDSTNTDKPDNNKISNRNTEDIEESMEQATSHIVSFQSKTNPKVLVTLVFPNHSNREAEKAENDLRNIFKNIQLEKFKEGAVQSEIPALGCSKLNLTEEKKNG